MSQDSPRARFIDPDAVRFAVMTRYPNGNYSDEDAVKWIAGQLSLKARGQAHDAPTVAIYEEHAKAA